MTHRLRCWVPLLLLAIAMPALPASEASSDPHQALPASEASSDPRQAQFAVVVPVMPYAFIIDRIAGGRVTPLTLVPAGQSPHSYSPGPQQIASIAEARVIFRTGLPLEQGVVSRLESLNQEAIVIDMTSVVTEQHDSLDAEYGQTGGHANDDKHDHTDGRDLHVWLSPANISRQARLMAETLAHVDPAGAHIYETGLDSLLSDVARLEHELDVRLAPFAGSRFYVFHPAFGHFAEAFHLEQVAVEFEGKEPSAKRLASLVKQARVDGVHTILVQPQFSDSAARTLAREIGADLALIDPLAYDLFATLRSLADAIAPADADTPTDTITPPPAKGIAPDQEAAQP